MSVPQQTHPGQPAGAHPELAIYAFEPPAAPRTLVDIFNASALAHPTAPAIDNGTQSLSYDQLARQIAVLSCNLRANGVGRGDRIGIRVTSGSLELYVSILAVLAAGAAYVPVDVDDPDERADLVWTEAGVCAVLTDDYALCQRQARPAPITQDTTPTLEDDAWIIFTSGSTGKPKGVAVSHRSAAAFVDAEAKLFFNGKPLGPGDRVLAGLSVAFDASCEEMWLAWRYGACLVPTPRSLVKAGADLGQFLVRQRISVVSTVPTLAALWPAEALRSLDLLILGGEACPPELAARLSRAVNGPVWNTYGPTEATVVSCAAPLLAGELVRIGLPLAGWRLAVVGPDGAAVPWGRVGELVIGGVGMARYLDQEKDMAKFAPAGVFSGQRAYRSGDLVRAERDGLVFVGRDDEQIKLGGRRVELGEIDAALMSLPGVSAAASAIRRSEMGTQLLVGYVVRDRSSGADDAADRALLRQVLPATLVPMLVTVADLPIRTSGKVDRKALPWPPPTPPPPSPPAPADASSPVDGTTAWLADQWRCLLGMPAASPDSNFFHLGGTSLAAAQLVSQLRRRCPTLSVADVYECPTLAAMASRVDQLSGTEVTARSVAPTTRWILLAQAPFLLALLAYEALRWLAALALVNKAAASASLGSFGVAWAGAHPLPWWLVVLGWVALNTTPGRLVVAAAVARILTAGVKPGRYQRGGSLHLRLWAAERFVAQSRIAAIAGTQWCGYYARLLGCQVGRDAQLHSLPPVTGLGSFGTSCAVEPEADVAGWWLDGDELHVGSVTVGPGARVGARSILLPGAVVEPFATVRPGVSVQGTAGKTDNHDRDGDGDHFAFEDEKFDAVSTSATFWTAARYTASLLLLDFLPFLLVAPSWGLVLVLGGDYRTTYRKFCVGLLKTTLPGTVLSTLIYAAVVVALVRLAGLAIRPGVYSWHGTAAWAAWLTHFLVMDARTALFPIYASLLTPTWLRLLGARVGGCVESSTVVPIPSLLDVDDGAFLADDVLLSPLELSAGRVRLGASAVGAKTFVGNSAIVHPGVRVPDGALIGVLGTAEDRKMEPGSSWLGRPPMRLPRRVEAEALADEALTFKPPVRLVLARALIESCRLCPLLISSLLTTLVGVAMLYVLIHHGAVYTLLSGVAVLSAAGLTACAITTAAKWLLTPVVRAGKQHPLWSSFVWRNELADTFVQSLAMPWLVRMCYGTPLLALFMRSLGAKIGRGVWLESHLLPEAELVQLDDGATVNRGCVLQTHLFHDRLMRLDRVRLEKGACLGPYAIALPGTSIGSGTTVAPTSLVMRGEHLPAGTRWSGNPIRPWDEEKDLGLLETRYECSEG
ncbi:uncharacterized protein UV8b_05532 [Ustilaginoidea virens]|uniref:Carrier domain-containing protein n=1 Tax=Ustilaginoidea virens TaxID=1159556 RepID=A0A063C380_USTVR|nr:uncharacterized protein UV8b_05532 [Ustilaginoidea virens]QUC21289.1 hypothetical protein UV8b_05532 [Ustilaginoidea virens]GAO17307.1 hypothetical protein UVI_02044650 [Ustilaginoidea virens]